MHFNLKFFLLASMAIAGLTGSTVAAEGSIQLRRGADYSSNGINRQLQAKTTGATVSYTAPGDENTTYGGTSGGTGSTYTPPPDKCPVEITLDSSQGATDVSNGSCSYVGGECAYRKDDLMYAQCDCVQASRNKSEWQCYPQPEGLSPGFPTEFPTGSPTANPTDSPPKDVCYDEKKCQACPVYKQGGVNWQDPNNCPYCDPTAPDCPPQYGMCTKDVTWCSTGGNEAASTQCAPCCNQKFDSFNERKDCQHACKETYLNICSGEWDENWERFLQRTGEQIPDPNFLKD